MEVLHTAYVSKSKIDFENTELSDVEKRNSYVLDTPTTTFPFLKTKSGNVSESVAIEFYLAKKNDKKLLGNSVFEKAKVNQWIEFASCEIKRSLKAIIYPIFGWSYYCKDFANKENANLKNYLKILENELKGKKYLLGDQITLADIVLFRYLRFFMMFHFPEGMRKNVLPNTTKWFENLMKTNEVKKAYGKIVLCKQPLKPFIYEKKDEKKQEKKEEKKEHKKEKKEESDEEDEEEKKSKKQKNPLDFLPPSSMDLEQFKRDYMNNKNKKDAVEKFWKVYDPEGYSLWWMEYQNLPSECKVLYRTSNSKSMFLQKLDQLRKYAFAVHGVYGEEGDYKIRGVWLLRGKDIPQILKENDAFEYMTVRKLDHNKAEDKQLVNDYWSKVKENDKVEGRFAADVSYFN